MRTGILNGKEFSANIKEGNGLAIYDDGLALAGSYFMYRGYFGEGHTGLFFSLFKKYCALFFSSPNSLYRNYFKVRGILSREEVMVMGKHTTKNLLAIAGIISTVLGVVGAMPSILQGQYLFATGSALFIILGLILLAIAFGD